MTVTFSLPQLPCEVCLVAYLGLFMLCVSYQVDERTCIQFAMKLEQPSPGALCQAGDPTRTSFLLAQTLGWRETLRDTFPARAFKAQLPRARIQEASGLCCRLLLRGELQRGLSSPWGSRVAFFSLGGFSAFLQLLYFLLSALGLMVCVLAAAFAAHRYLQLTQLTCVTAFDSCQCKLPSEEPLSRSFVYRDVTDCASVTGTLKLFLLIQMILNLVCGLVCLRACCVMWEHRYQVFYVGVRMCSLTPSEDQQQKV
ncbi:Sarcospan [Galemys pyrenaicus]|uniref:Sarcospan n=1 Tax=Galemys pyrenaicus TaxID=202257 RepID=A0A8J6ALL4_GALPY|nr:Sarcospan [Galemys pyrenaicus]